MLKAAILKKKTPYKQVMLIDPKGFASENMCSEPGSQWFLRASCHLNLPGVILFSLNHSIASDSKVLQ